jgi:NAD(P)-dependent dehydrogenase (short-subunit alcohol dehydrogenase family)
VDPSGVALVTGASRGLGRALAHALAARGFEVVAGVRQPSDADALRDEAAQAGLRLAPALLDVRRPAAFPVPEALRVLVNNAALDAPVLPVEEAPVEAWREVFETNLFGLVATTRLAIPALRRAGGGVICNVTSASLLFPMPLYALYRASKAAVSALGESLRAELAGFGIRLLEVLPGPIDTDMLAASDRPPEALALAAYRELAERAWAGRRGVAGAVTPPGAAAEAIVDAILDDGAPLRVACDPLGRGLLEGWRAAPDEEWLRGLLTSFGLPASAAPRRGSGTR